MQEWDGGRLWGVSTRPYKNIDNKRTGLFHRPVDGVLVVGLEVGVGLGEMFGAEPAAVGGEG